MKLRRLTLEGITRFRGQVDLDFEALGEGLVAFVGPNGAGKTTLLECSGPGALFRELPTRPDSALANWVGPRGGFVELRFSSGLHAYEAEVRVPSKGSPTAVLRVDGTAVTSGKVKDFDAAVEERFGKREALYASAFAGQGGKGRFASLSVADRKAVFRHYLGLGRVDAVHAAAKARLSRFDLSRAERLGTEAAELRASLPGREEALRLRKADEDAAGGKRDAAEEALRGAEKAAAAGAGVSAYRRALADVLAAEEALSRAEAAPRPAVPDPGVDPEVAAAEVEEAREAAEVAGSLAADLEEARELLSEAERLAEDARERAAELSRVPCGGAGKFAACKFLAEARAAEESLPDLEVSAAEAGELVQIRERAVEEADPPPDVRALEARWREAARLSAERERAAAALARRDGSVESAKAALRDARRRAIALRKELPDPLPEAPSEEEVRSARKAAAEARSGFDAAVRARAQAQASLDGAKERAESLEAERKKELASAADGPALQLLVRAFGPGGIQALEIDAAGPTVSALANELASACYGDRFSLEIRTQRELKSRAGSAEDFEVHVADAERGRVGTLDSFSGGEQAVLSEVLRTALCLFAVSSRSGVEYLTLWRDEPSSALDAENKPAYARMLHKARALGGFHQVLAVTHDQEVADAADVVVEVSGSGAVSVHRS